ncbi:MAG: hypothetical protein M1815_000308 [Lichina confinis]|nr:MAG: hypothetical protein M1815_000308 [Lichina confinis]
MTTVATRSPLRTLTMSTQRPARRRSARLAFGNDETRSPSVENLAPPAKRVRKDDGKTINGKASAMLGTTVGERTRSKKTASYDEEDDGFRFTRTRAKKAKAAAARAVPETVPEDDGDTVSTARDAASAAASKTATDTAKPRAKRKSKGQSKAEDQLDPTLEPPRERNDVERREQIRPDGPGAAQRTPQTKAQTAANAVETAASTSTTVEKTAENTVEKIAENAPETTAEHTAETTVDDTQKIALPFSDTPVIKRNKEFRQRASKGHRRSSTGLRGRRASSLIESGSDALPHPEVSNSDFYKHIEGHGLSEPRRMRQLLTWCGARVLQDERFLQASSSTTTATATKDDDAQTAHGMLKELVKDFARRSEMSDWFDRKEATPPPRPKEKKPNPRNVANLGRIQQLEEQLMRLQEERRTWERFSREASLSSLSASIPPLPPTLPTTDPASSLESAAASTHAPAIPASIEPSPPRLAPEDIKPAVSPTKPDPSRSPLRSTSTPSLDKTQKSASHAVTPKPTVSLSSSSSSSAIPPLPLPDQPSSAILSSAIPPPPPQNLPSSLPNLPTSTESTLRRLTAPLEFQVDCFRDGMHRLTQYQASAERVGDHTLARVAACLDEREKMRCARSGTKDIPLVEVLRALSRLEARS